MVWNFIIESMVHGYHQYKSIWENPVHDEKLSCTRDIGNSHEPMAVAISKEIDGDIITVGCVPRRISALCTVFIRRGGTIRCIVNCHQRYSRDLPQGGFEIPCFLVFTAKTSVEANKTKELLQSLLSDCKVHEQQTASTPTGPNETLCSSQAAIVSVAAEAGRQVSVPVLQVDLTTESAAVPTECLPPKKTKTI